MTIGPAFGGPTRRPSGNLRVFDESKTDPTNDLYFIKQLGSTTTVAVETALDDRTVTLTDATDFPIGTYLGLSSTDVQDVARYYFGTVMDRVGNVVTVDVPLDYTYKVGSFAIATTREMNVNGAVTPQVFSVRAGGANTNFIVDITRVMISMETTSPVNLNTFGNITPLTNGVFMRHVNGEYRNKWVVKKNSDFGILAYDWTPYLASNPAQAVDGFLCRYTINGPDKHDAVIRLYPGEELQIIIQDDLTALESFRMMAAIREYGCY